uniref:Uncharacterized protein n=1 Tax=Lepeophtheirus salmonis TaxID=72036 RepID=A0A0K2V697_LEPSM
MIYGAGFIYQSKCYSEQSAGMTGIHQLLGAIFINERKITSKRLHFEKTIVLSKTYKIFEGELDRHKTFFGRTDYLWVYVNYVIL